MFKRNRHIAETRETELKTKEEFWGDMIGRGSKVCRVPNDQESARQLLCAMVQGNSMTLKIQKELVDEEKKLDETAAGLSFFELETSRMKEEHEQQRQEMEQRLKNQLREKEEEAAREKEALKKSLRGEARGSRSCERKIAAEKGAERGIRTGVSRVLEARDGGDATENHPDRGKDYPGKIPESHHQSKAAARPIHSECV